MVPENLRTTYECCGMRFVIEITFKGRKRSTTLITEDGEAHELPSVQFCPGCGAKIPDVRVNGEGRVPLPEKTDPELRVASKMKGPSPEVEETVMIEDEDLTPCEAPKDWGAEEPESRLRGIMQKPDPWKGWNPGV